MYRARRPGLDERAGSAPGTFVISGPQDRRGSLAAADYNRIAECERFLALLGMTADCRIAQGAVPVEGTGCRVYFP